MRRILYQSNFTRRWREKQGGPTALGDQPKRVILYKLRLTVVCELMKPTVPIETTMAPMKIAVKGLDALQRPHL